MSETNGISMRSRNFFEVKLLLSGQM